MELQALSATDPGRRRRGDYPHLDRVATRWEDNDVYGHVNNVAYYSYFDTVINRYLIGAGGLDIHHGPVVGFAAESQCRFFRPAAFPAELEAGMRVAHLGTSSVRYEIGLFTADDEAPCAAGTFVHVFVDRHTGRPSPIPDAVRRALAALA